jgi:protein tyrosine phosphatase (PTP) superfamily phosphohydrolase (DUF442 family)
MTFTTNTHSPVKLPNGASPLPGVLTAGQPSAAQLSQLALSGVKTVIDLRSPSEHREFDEPATVRDAGLNYRNIPVTPTTLSEREFDEVRTLLRDENARPVLVHCGSANRVGALLIPYLMLDERRSRDDALRIARDVGLRSDDLARAALSYVGGHEDGAPPIDAGTL